MTQEAVRGTFRLVYLGFDGLLHQYAVEDVNWTVPFASPGEPLRVIGAGTYLIGSPDPLGVLQHRMELDLAVGDDPVAHFDSGWVPIEDVGTPHFNITVSMNDMYCFDTVFVIDADPVPETEIYPYGLVEGSTFQRGCFDPCDCPLGPEYPMVGMFALVPLVEEPLHLTEFAVVNVDWRVLFSDVPESIPIRGYGVYQLLGDFVLQHRLALELTVGDEERTHFDSGALAGGGEFPRIDIIVSVNNMVCEDTVLHVIGEPVDGSPCGGMFGIPCPEGEFCKMPVGQCDSGGFGTCTTIPTGCPDVWDPVCGCDGVTYGNECEADAAAVSIAHYGECAPYCVVDSDCPPDHFCKFTVGTCGDAAVPGVCTPIPDACPDVWDPVCGCDGVTYGNECEADAAAVSIDYWGECAGTPCAATRFFVTAADSYCPGVPQAVEIVITPPAGTLIVALEDEPPEDWAVTDISNGGTFDAVNWKVKWGPFFAPSIPPAVTYGVVPPGDAAGLACFDGTISVDGINEQVCGDSCIELSCPPFMEADLPQLPCPDCPIGDCTTCPDGGCRDGRISLCEVIGYACAWKIGCNDDLAGMARAAYIWRNGECYCWDEAEKDWFPSACPPPASGLCIDAGGGAGSAVGAVAANLETAPVNVHRLGGRGANATAELRVSVPVTAPESALVMALEVDVPRHWKVLTVSDDGQWDGRHRKVKWGPFFDNLSRTVTIGLVSVRQKPATNSPRAKRIEGLRGFTGQVSFDGVTRPITVR